MLENVNQNKQIFEPNSDFTDFVHQIRQKRNTYQDHNYSVGNIDFGLEASNIQRCTIAVIAVEAQSSLHQFKLMMMTYEKNYVR